jgi:hypothetical protein
MAIANPTDAAMSGEHNPVFVWRIQRDPSDAEIRSWASSTLAWARTIDEPFAWLGDMRFISIASAKQRMQVVDFAQETRSIFATHCRAFAVVAPSPVARMLLTGFLWFWSPPCPHRVFDDFDSALIYCRQQLGIHRKRAS